MSTRPVSALTETVAAQIVRDAAGDSTVIAVQLAREVSERGGWRANTCRPLLRAFEIAEAGTESCCRTASTGGVTANADEASNLRAAIAQHDDAHATVAAEREARYLRDWQQADTEIKRLRAELDASIVPGLVENSQWAAKKCVAALQDSRVDGVAAVWLRDILRVLSPYKATEAAIDAQFGRHPAPIGTATTQTLAEVLAPAREDELRDALLRLSDTLDPEEGPVILAWSVDRLAERLAQELDDDGAKCDCVNCNSGRPHSGPAPADQREKP